MRISKYLHKHREGMMMTTKIMNIFVQLYSQNNAAPSDIHLTRHGEYALLGSALIPPFPYS